MGNPVTGGYNYTHLSGAGTTTILGGIGATQGSSTSPGNVGILGGLYINTAGTSVTVYDGPSSAYPVVAVFGATTGELEQPIQLKQGLTIVIVGAADVTVLWL
jgi:hypothetical protein